MSSFRWITQDFVLALHDWLLSIDCGGEGIRDQNLLESALHRPRNMFLHEQAGLFELAACYTAGIIQNHPFIDGNKRTGLIVGATFLEYNGYRLIASEVDTTQVILAVAEGNLGEEELSRWFKNSVDRISQD